MPKLNADQAKVLKDLEKLNKKLKIPSQSFKADKEGNLIELRFANFSEQLRSIKDEIGICFIACFESNFYDYLEFLNIIKPKMTIPYHFTAEKERDARKLVDFLSNNNFNSRFLEIGEEFEF